MRGESPKGHLDMLLLAAIAGGSTHGYAIAQALRRASGETFDLQDGTIYPALQRLERAGLLVSCWSEGAGRRRRIYALTPAGHQTLDRQQKEWKRFESAVHGVLALVRP